MKLVGFCPIIVALLLLAVEHPSSGWAAPTRISKLPSHEIHFRADDSRAQGIARKLLAKEIADEEDMPSDLQSLRTAWVEVSRGKSPDLLVMYGCSAVGNCGVYGFESTKRGWRRVLTDDVQQMLFLLPSSHGGHRDISAYGHGTADEGTLTTYWWRKKRYERMSERDVIFK